MDEALSRIERIFRDVFDNPALRISREDHAGTVEQWDSLAHITLVSAVEQEFGVRFALGELEDLKNVGDMLDLIETKSA